MSSDAKPQQSVLMRLVRAISTLSSFTLLSRLFGLAREVVVAAFFGSGPIADAYATALKLPNMFRQMFAEGAFSASFVPVFTEKQDKEGQEPARHFASAVASAMILLIGTATILAIIFMRPIVTLLDPPAESFEYVVTFTRIMSVYLLCMVLTSLLTGVLNAKQHFAAGAIAPIFLNLFIIAGLVFAAQALGLADEGRGLALAISVAIAGFAQIALVWFVAATKFKFVLYLPRPRLGGDVKRLFRLMVPGIIAAGGLQLNTLVGAYLALRESGGASQLAYAERLYQLPVGLIAVAFGVAALPQLSTFFANQQIDRAKDTIRLGVELALLIAVPAAFALVAMPEVIVKLLFERGKFTAENTAVVAGLIAIFATALPALSLQRVFNASFHARKKMRPPMILTLCGVTLNVVIAVRLTPTLGLVAIPMALAISAWAQVFALALWVRLEGLWLPNGGTIWRALAIVLSGVSMMGVLVTMKDPLMGFVGDSTLRLLLVTAAMVFTGMLVYFASVFLLQGITPEIRGMLKRKK